MLGELYAPFVRTGNPILFMDIPSAEVTKYAANAMLATRISFMNQIADFCERVGRRRARRAARHRHRPADRQRVPLSRARLRRLLLPEGRQGASSGPPATLGMQLDLLEAVERGERAAEAGAARRRRSPRSGATSPGETVAVWGLAFKAETDDMRESPSIPLVEGLLAAGARVQAHDPKAMETRAGRLRRPRGLRRRSLQCARTGADALVIVTEWLVYRNPDFERIRSAPDAGP